MARNQSMAIVAFIVVVVFAALQPFTSAKEHVVGDDKGWTVGVNYTEWAMGKEFNVGDTLVFNYQAGSHNVIKVDGPAFKACEVPMGANALVSGNDVITLAAPGNKWYICGKPNHCASNQKLVITVHPGLMAPGVSPSMPPTSGSSERIPLAMYQNFMTIAMAVVMVIVMV